MDILVKGVHLLAQLAIASISKEVDQRLKSFGVCYHVFWEAFQFGLGVQFKCSLAVQLVDVAVDIK